MMDRRSFVKHLALLAAGASALPNQIAAFEHYYEKNTYGATGLVAVDEFAIAGLATSMCPVTVDIMYGNKVRLPVACNLFGGIFVWKALPDQRFVQPGKDLSWLIKASTPAYQEVYTSKVLKFQFRAHMSYIDQEGVRHTRPLTECEGTLA